VGTALEMVGSKFGLEKCPVGNPTPKYNAIAVEGF